MKKRNEIEQQFAILAEEHQGIIHKVCSMYCPREADRKDLFQDILVQWWRAFPSFKGDAKFSTWAYRVAINTAISNFRKEKRRLDYQSLSSEVLQIPDLPNANEGMEEQKDLLYRAINQLSKVEKAIMMLYLEDYNYIEIAQIIGITKTNVGVKINRIKGKLKQILVISD
ncbi:MAG: RNA polymerase sigma factor [Saprospiraceae bacterium]